ncbi:MAG: deoxyribose-phosphate aldolase [Nitrospirae bacterium]|nr:deoxyribose-phosphate aldolase [Nitrospirota bacterium]MCL5237099.1 deoxyribose-phosphate aldolase [Nitrospirota bacterium]
MSKRKKGKARPYGSEKLSPGQLARFIDQSLLKPEATEADIIKLCKGAIKYNFYSVCVHPYYVPLCKAILTGYDTKVATVIGFPHGVTMKNVKVYEAMQSVLYGAQELDIVMNIGAVKSGNWCFLEEELSGIISASGSVIHKVIIETCYLDEEEKRSVARIAVVCGARFVKTSTGFGPKGATVRDVKLIKDAVGDKAAVKAAGGIKTLAQMLKLIKAGATRIGTSAGVGIMKEAMSKGSNE